MVSILAWQCSFLGSFLFAQTQTSSVRGRIVDTAGDAVPGAEIRVTTEAGTSVCLSANDGTFLCELSGSGITRITVRAEGFSILRQDAAEIQELRGENEFRLTPQGLSAEVVVSSSKARTSVVETSASIDSISAAQIESTSAQTVDGIAQRSVGFSLFRRTDSRSSNPTTQGASLRGVNASGASRTRVLFDDIPLNDPFGGWVVWNRVSKSEVERIELLRGGSSSIYGTGSVGGTINIVSKSASEGFTFGGEVSAGSQNTFDSAFYSGFARSGWLADVSASTFQTRGFRIVDEDVRGTVDDFANSRNTNFSGRIANSLNPRLKVFGRARYFGEARNNGTPVQKNRTHIRQFDAGIDADLSGNGLTTLSVRAFGGTQVFDQNFSAVFGSRNGEVLVRLQRVPAQQLGANSTLRTFFRGNALIFGGEFTEIRGSSNEIGFFGGNATSLLGAGGRERRYSFFFQDFYRASDRVSLSGSIRFDNWKKLPWTANADQDLDPAFDGRHFSATGRERGQSAGLRDAWDQRLPFGIPLCGKKLSGSDP